MSNSSRYKNPPPKAPVESMGAKLDRLNNVVLKHLVDHNRTLREEYQLVLLNQSTLSSQARAHVVNLLHYIKNQSMAKTKKRLYFSQKDGTKLSEDLKALLGDIDNSVDAFLLRIITQASEHKNEIEAIILFITGINDAIKEGTPADAILDQVKERIPGDFDNNLIEMIQKLLPVAIEKYSGVTNFFEFVTNWLNATVYERQSMKMKIGSLVLNDLTGLEIINCDTIMQTSVAYMKS